MKVMKVPFGEPALRDTHYGMSDFDFKAHHTIQFSTSYGLPVLSITPDGKLVPGEGLSDDEVTRRVFNAMANQWPELIKEWAAKV